MKNRISVALLGLGTVGSGVYKVLNSQAAELPAKLGCEVCISHILVRNLEKAAVKVNDPSILTTDWKEIVDDPEVDIVVEVMGGLEPACTYIEEALAAGKNVVTANKDLIASVGSDLPERAAAMGKDLLFEAAVAGGIPIIRPLNQCLAGNRLDRIMGIVNGTTNFILTRMTMDGMDFSEALVIAQQLGYAEADPAADVEGLDAARKVAIMATCGFHTPVRFENVSTEGITHITARDISYAGEMGNVIKLLGICQNTDEGIEVSVSPMLIPKKHPLASVNDAFNAVFLHGDAVGDAMFYGRGAGELPTASAVVGDILDICRDILFNCTGRSRRTVYLNLPVKKPEEISSKYYIRMHAVDRYGVLAAVTSIFGCHQVNIEQIIQRHKEENGAEIVVITEAVKDKHLRSSIEAIAHLEVIQSIDSVIRVYTE